MLGLLLVVFGALMVYFSNQWGFLAILLGLGMLLGSKA